MHRGRLRAALLETVAGEAASGDWNGLDWYVSFGQGAGGRQWVDARAHGFVSAGGGEWYSRTLRRLPEGGRVFVLVPGSGYVGVGTVCGPAQRFDQAVVEADGVPRRLVELPLTGSYQQDAGEPDEMAEWVVPVQWLHTVDLEEAVWQAGMFANQNTAVRLRHAPTAAAVLSAFGLD